MFKIIFIVSAFCGFVFADSQLLASMSNQEDSSIVRVYAEVGNEGDILTLDFMRFVGQKVRETESLTPEDMLGGKAVGRHSGRDILRIQSRNFSSHQGGRVELRYLHNGITGSWRVAVLDLSRKGDDWFLSHRGREVKSAHVFSKKFFGKTVGIEKITFVYGD